MLYYLYIYILCNAHYNMYKILLVSAMTRNSQLYIFADDERSCDFEYSYAGFSVKII